MTKTSIYTICLTGLAALASCAITPPPGPPADLPNVFAVAASPEKTWVAVTDALLDHRLQIDQSDRDGGLVTTAWTELPTDDAGRFMACGTVMGMQMAPNQNAAGWVRLQASIRPGEQGGSSIRIRPTFQLWVRGHGPVSPDGSAPTECTTTGVLERELIAAIK